MKKTSKKKLNKKKVILITSSILIVIICCIIVVLMKNTTYLESNYKNEVEIEQFEEETEKVNKEDSNIKQEMIESEENNEVEELKKSTGVKGNSSIYEIQTEFEGQKILTVKKSVRFKTVFAGIIKKGLPQLSELDDIFNKNYPNKKGIWIEKNSRSKVLELLNNGSNNKYNINNDGYLQIKNKTPQNEIDKKIEKAINGNKTIILNISSVCYIVDDMTGNIENYNFEENDKSQTHEYFENEDNLIIFITENKENQLDKIKILENIVQLF